MKKKVLHLRSSSALLGAENVLIELAKNSTTLGYDAIIGVLHDTRDPLPELYKLAETMGLPCHCFKAQKRLDWQCIADIRSYIDKHNISILHTHGYREDIYACLTATHIKKIATNHLWKKTNFTEKTYALLDALALRTFEVTVGVSDNVVQDMQRYGIPSNKLKKIENGINIQGYSQPTTHQDIEQEKHALGLPKCPIITMISSLTIEKSHHTAIEAFAQLIKEQKARKNTGTSASKQEVGHLLIVGEGPQRPFIEALIQEHQLQDHVTLLGRRKDIAKILTISDIFLMTSTNEGLPMALLEAMAAGKAIVATQVGGIPDLIKTPIHNLLPTANDFGWGVPPDDIQAVFHALKILCENTALRCALGNNAQRKVAEQYSAKKMASEYCRLYTEVMAN